MTQLAVYRCTHTPTTRTAYQNRMAFGLCEDCYQRMMSANRAAREADAVTLPLIVDVLADCLAREDAK